MTDDKKFPNAPEGRQWWISLSAGPGKSYLLKVCLVHAHSRKKTLDQEVVRKVGPHLSRQELRGQAVDAAKRVLELREWIKDSTILAVELNEEANGRPVVPS